MEEERKRDFIVPLIYGLFFISCVTGGILLTIWLLDEDGSKPWFPILALVLIGFPWIFWFLTYLYTFIISCFRRGGGGGDVGFHAGLNRTKPEPAATNVDLAPPLDSSVNFPDRKREVKFGPVIVIDGDRSGDHSGHHLEDGGESSIASREAEMPLAPSVVS